jgi:hypothetical protein
MGGYYDERHESTYLTVGLAGLWRNFVLNDVWMLITPINRILWGEWSMGLRVALAVVGGAEALALLGSLSRAVVLLHRIDERALVRIGTGFLWAVIMLLPVAPLRGVEGSLDQSRYLYMPAAGVCLWIGAAAGLGWEWGVQWRRISVALLVLVLLFSGVALRRHNQAWLEAGEIAQRMHAVMAEHTSQLTDDSRIFVVNFPWLWKGAHCAPLSYEGWVEYAYGAKDVRSVILQKNPEEVEEWWEGVRWNWRRPAVGFEWDRSNLTLRVLPPVVLQSGARDELGMSLGPELPATGTNEEEVEVFAEPSE